MSPQRLALRTVLLGRPRTVLAILVVAASLSVLDLFAGHIASVRAVVDGCGRSRGQAASKST